MVVRDILKVKPGKVITVSQDTKIVEAMGILIDNKIGCLPVVDSNKRLVGIISDKDIFMAVYKDLKSFESATMLDIMTANLIVGVPDDDLEYIAGLMTKNRIRHIPVMEDDELVGMISIGDLVKSQIDDMEIENRYLRQYIDGSYPG